MTEWKNLCLGCMNYIGDADVCPVCGWNRGEVQSLPFLPEGCDVGGRYIVGRKISSGGDGTTYIGYDLDTGKKVHLREFLPDAIASRDSDTSALKIINGCEKVFSECRDEFYKLWDKLIKLRGLSALIPVNEIVNDYATAYAVIDIGGTETLDSYLNSLPSRRMSWDSLKNSMLPLLSTLGTLHSAGIIHGGISPETIRVSKDGRFYLDGFRIIQSRCAVGDLNAELYSGYSAAEQYGARQKIGSWSDVYAVAAVIYRCLVGQDPIPAPQRMIRDDLIIPGDVARMLPAYVIDAIINAFQTKPENRSVDTDELRAGLLNRAYQKKTYPLSFYNYNDISYVNQDKKPYIAETEYFSHGREIPKPSERGGANVTRRYGTAQNDTLNEEKNDSSAGTKKAVVSFITVLLIFGIGAGVYFGFLSDSPIFGNKEINTTQTTTQATYSVPDLKGRTDVSLKSDATLRSQFTLVYQQEYSADVAEGYVIRQSAEAGTVLQTGAELIVYISLGPKALVVPNVVGIEAEQAKSQLESMGFKVEITEKTNDGSGQQGYVGSVVPEQGTDMKQGDTVYLHVWGAPPTQATTTSAFNLGGNGNSPGGLFNWF